MGSHKSSHKNLKITPSLLPETAAGSHIPIVMNSANLTWPSTANRATMAGKRNILLITDSRGRFLQGYLNHHNRNFHMINYTVEVHSGSKLGRVWRLTKQHIEEKKYDLIYLLGGICDITHKQYVKGNKIFWPNMAQGQIGSELIEEYTQIVAEFNGLESKNETKICLIPKWAGTSSATTQPRKITIL